MHSRCSLQQYNINLSSLLLDFSYISFLFIGVLENGPPLSRSSIDATVISGLFLTTGSVIQLFRGGKVPISSSNLMAQVSLIGLLSWMSITLLWAPSNIGSEPLFRMIIGLTIGFSYPMWIIGPDWKRIMRVLWMIAGFGVVLALYYIVIGAVPAITPNRISLARPIGIASVFLTTRAAINSGRPALKLWTVIGVLFVALFQIGARGPAGAAIICSLIVVVWIHYKEKKVIRTNLTLLVVTSCIVLAGVFFRPIGITSLQTLERFNYLLNGGIRSIPGRIDMWQWSLTSWSSSSDSILFGKGMGAFATNYSHPSTYGYPHNLFVELVHTGGLIALSLFILFSLYSIRGIFVSDHTSGQIAIIGVVLYMAINAQFTGDLYTNKYLFALIGFLAISSYGSGESFANLEFDG